MPARDGGEHVGRRDRAVVLDVRRDLDDVAALEVQAERAHAGQPSSPPSRIAAAIARASSSVAGGASSRLKAISGGRAATSVAPAVGCSAGGP